MSQLRKQAVKRVGRAWSFAKCQSLKLAVSVGMFAMSTGTMLANSKGAGGFSKATTEISSYQTPVSNLMKAIAATDGEHDSLFHVLVAVLHLEIHIERSY